MISSFLVSVLATVGLIQGFLVAFYLIFKGRGNDRFDIFLGIALLGLSLRILKSVLNYHLSLGPINSSLGLSGILLTGPFLFFYIRSLISKIGLSKVELLHVAPFTIYLLLIPFVSDLFHRYLNYWIALIHLGFYLCWIIFYLRRSRRGATRDTMVWIYQVIGGVVLVWIFYFLNLVNVDMHYLTGPVQYSFITYWFTFLLLSRKPPRVKYKSSQLTKGGSSELYKELVSLFEKKEVYLQAGISLELVADHLGVPPRFLSQAINENANKNFKSLLNDYRVERAKSLLLDSKYSNEKIATIAYESGYNNVTSFNLAFKRVTGQTPSQFR